MIEDLVLQKSTNKTRLERLEADYILKQIGGAYYDTLADKYFQESGQYFYLAKLETIILDFFLQRHIAFLKNIRDIFFYFDISYTGRVKRVRLLGRSSVGCKFLRQQMQM